jgi:hypothetical protein
MAYVYQHIRLDTNEVFYIGIGSDTEGKYIRANKKTGRNPYWHSIVNKAGYRVEILKDGINWEEACEEEKRFIKLYGRRNLNEGNLVNLTDGGDGATGIIVTDDHKQKISESLKLLLKTIPRSAEHRQKISEGNMGKIHTPEHRKKVGDKRKGKLHNEESKLKIKNALLGKKHSEEHKQKISEANKGKKRGAYDVRYKKLNTIPPKPHQFF